MHALREVWPQAEGWELDFGIKECATVPSLEEIEEMQIQTGVVYARGPTVEWSNSEHQRFKEKTGFGSLLSTQKMDSTS